MNMSPCKGCEERHDLCHASCEKYLSAKEKRLEELRKYREDCWIGATLDRLRIHGATSRKQKRRAVSK